MSYKYPKDKETKPEETQAVSPSSEKVEKKEEVKEPISDKKAVKESVLTKVKFIKRWLNKNSQIVEVHTVMDVDKSMLDHLTKFNIVEIVDIKKEK